MVGSSGNLLDMATEGLKRNTVTCYMLWNYLLAVCHSDVFKHLMLWGDLNFGAPIWYWAAWILFLYKAGLRPAHAELKEIHFRLHTYPGPKEKSSQVLGIPANFQHHYISGMIISL